MSILLKESGLVNRSHKKIAETFHPLEGSARVRDLLGTFELNCMTTKQRSFNFNMILKTHAESCTSIHFPTESAEIYDATMTELMTLRCAAALGLNAESIDGLKAKFEDVNKSGINEHFVRDMSTAPMDGTWVLLFARGDFSWGSDAPLYSEVCKYHGTRGWVSGGHMSFAEGLTKPIGWCLLPEL